MIRVLRIYMMLVVAALLSLLSVSCDELIWEGEGDCHTSYTVTFSYTMNMEYADAFAHYVDSVTLCAFTADSVLSYVKVSSGEELIANGQAMAVDDITPGYYTLVAWAMGEEAVAGCWSLPELVVGQTRLEDVTCCLNTTRGDTTEVSHDLTPLFHAMVTNADLTSVGYDGSRNVDMDLTKNTNVVRIVLQHLSGKDINVSDFTFDVVSDNGSMAHDNSLLEGGDIAYTPWATASTSAEVYSTTDEGEDTTSVYAAVAEMTTSRLVYGNATRLTVRNAQTGDRVLSIPLIDYALLVKGKYSSALTEQEYLDRQDEYSITFFLDDNGNWISSTIIINSWRLVLSDVEL